MEDSFETQYGNSGDKDVSAQTVKQSVISLNKPSGDKSEPLAVSKLTGALIISNNALIRNNKQHGRG